MVFRAETLIDRAFPVIRQAYSTPEAILYALGLGCGADPTDAKGLAFVYEEGLAVLPTFATVLAAPGFWAKEDDTGVDWRKVLHGEQGVVLHKPLPVSAEVEGRLRITSIVDRGEKGAFIYQDREIADAKTGALLATLSSLTIARGDGGCGDAGPPPKPVTTPFEPDRTPDQTVTLPISKRAALIYRLSGDFNPLHADPNVAKSAGFAAPILHGLCSFGMACRAVVETVCDYDPSRLKAFSARFSKPVFPGETLLIDLWREGDRVRFQARVAERDLVALSQGEAVITD